MDMSKQKSLSNNISKYEMSEFLLCSKSESTLNI